MNILCRKFVQNDMKIYAQDHNKLFGNITWKVKMNSHRFRL